MEYFHPRNRLLFGIFVFQLGCSVFFIACYLRQGKISPKNELSANGCKNSKKDGQDQPRTLWNIYRKSRTEDVSNKPLELSFRESVQPSEINQSSMIFNLPTEQPIPRIVHMLLWTDSLTFRNYLSILSVWKILNPYQIILYTRTKFMTKEFEYDDWFLKATSRISSLQVMKLDVLDMYNYTVQTELDVALSVLKKFGGVYVNINTIINADLWTGSNESFVVGSTADWFIVYIAIARNANVPDKFIIKQSTESRHISSFPCVTSKTFTDSDICCTMEKGLFPYHIMRDNSSFGYLARTLFYGKPEVPEPKASFPPIPKLVHYVWFGEKDIDYSMFMSFLSTQRFVKPLKIYIYVDHNISRPYFDKMLAYSNVQVVYYGSLYTVFQKPLAKTLHVSDIIRADVLMRYGGVYVDWDVYWLKLADELFTRGHETIASLDFFKDMFPRQGFPDTINMGVLLARPGSRFLLLWHDSFKKYTGKHHTYHAVELVYKLYEEHPDLLVIDKRLQVMCHFLRCHPLWIKNYKDDNIHTDFDFTKDAYTVHFTEPTPKEFSSLESIRNAKNFFGDMGRHILGI